MLLIASKVQNTLAMCFVHLWGRIFNAELNVVD